jgi:hypothetical protein
LYTCSELNQLNLSLTRELITANGVPPFLKKERDKASLPTLIGHGILLIFRSVMHQTQSLTRLHVIVESVFANKLFGSFSTGEVLKEISTKYAQGTIFLPWKVF